MSEYMQTGADGTYVGYNEDAVYLDPDWADPNASAYVQDGTTRPGGGGGGEIQAFVGSGETTTKACTTISKGNGYATVRSNVEINFRGSIPLNGSISGRLPPGCVFQGKDSNGNGIPDILEKQIKKGNIRF